MKNTDETTLWLGAFRYYCGRMTYAVSNFCELLKATWPFLSEDTKALIQRDLEEEFKRDDLARKSQNKFHFPLGQDCDREQWQAVRDLYKIPEGDKIN